MKVLVVGGSGFIGRRLVAALRERGDEVVVSGRSEASLRKRFKEGVACVEWDPMAGPFPAEALAGVDGVVNLAGEPVQGRWTKGKKERIRDSRVVGTRNLVAGMVAAESGPKVLVSASAIGWYGDTKHNRVYENALPGKDFLAEVCQEWEAEAVKARESGIRTAIVRVGVVLGKGGGAYPQMSRPFRFFAGSKIGLGRAWLSWIHIDDCVGVFVHCLHTEEADAVYNATAPNPVANETWTKTLASVLRRPAIFPPVPPIALRVLLGGFASVVTASTRAMPVRTLGVGYEFKYPELRPALESLER